MNPLQNRMDNIRETLRRRNHELAASLLISTVSSDDMFRYWSGCCHGSERVPKILKYIRHIIFDENVVTANINFNKGELRIGAEFFMQYLNGPEDLLFILIHERNHLILRKLYPGVMTHDYPGLLFNFAEDAYINAVSRRHLPSTLPERFYSDPMELLLTGRHGKIDWDYFKVDGDEANPIREAHGYLYQHNQALLTIIQEAHVGRHQGCGYKKWMYLVLTWHEQMRAKPRPEPKDNTRSKTTEETAQDEAAHSDERATGPVEEDIADTGDEAESTDGDEQASESPNPDESGSGASQEAGEDEPDDGDEQSGQGSVEHKEDKDTGVAATLKRIIPLVQKEEEDIAPESSGGAGKAQGTVRIPLPDITPHDPVVRMILDTCDVFEFRNEVLVFDGEAVMQVEGFIKGVLNDRATERTYDGYSVSVPVSVTRRDVFALASGNPPVLWQRRVGIERPLMDLYVDVSGSMNQYYGYIPFIYDALKQVMGRIFQFSTQVVEVHYQDKYLHTTGGTNFNVVAKHMLQERVEAAVLLSDGMAVLTQGLLKMLKQQVRHFVYIKVEDNSYRSWELMANRVIQLNRKEDNNEW